ncbi:MAG: P-II family nitrogen regulator [Clostridia bacterium]|nr:P-II family nitrogen regulator [Clostridia bacterium]
MNNDYEVIFAIVNAGYAQDAMHVARKHGARGGTIINGRGVAREKEATFFGITIHREKELLMLIVEKDIRDKVFHALYQEMGMQQKAQGIIFSLPVEEAAGLAQPTEGK